MSVSSPKPGKIKDLGAAAAQACAPFQQSLLPPDTYETGEDDLLWISVALPDDSQSMQTLISAY